MITGSTLRRTSFLWAEESGFCGAEECSEKACATFKRHPEKPSASDSGQPQHSTVTFAVMHLRLSLRLTEMTSARSLDHGLARAELNCRTLGLDGVDSA